MVSLFSLYKTKWQKLPRFLGQKCFRGAFKDTENKEIYSTEQKMLGEKNYSYIQKYKTWTDLVQSHILFNNQDFALTSNNDA